MYKVKIKEKKKFYKKIAVTCFAGVMAACTITSFAAPTNPYYLNNSTKFKYCVHFSGGSNFKATRTKARYYFKEKTKPVVSSNDYDNAFYFIEFEDSLLSARKVHFYKGISRGQTVNGNWNHGVGKNYKYQFCTTLNPDDNKSANNYFVVEGNITY